MITILETLLNADHNLQTGMLEILPVAKRQLHNSVVFLTKGYGLRELIDPILEKYPNPEDAPEVL